MDINHLLNGMILQVPPLPRMQSSQFEGLGWDSRASKWNNPAGDREWVGGRSHIYLRIPSPLPGVRRIDGLFIPAPHVI